MSSGEWRAKALELEQKKRDFEELSGQLEVLNNSFTPVISSYNSVGEYLKEVVIDGKPMDEGKLKEHASTLSKHQVTIQKLSMECMTKINQLAHEITSAWSNYQTALAREQSQSVNDGGE